MSNPERSGTAPVSEPSRDAAIRADVLAVCDFAEKVWQHLDSSTPKPLVAIARVRSELDGVRPPVSEGQTRAGIPVMCASDWPADSWLNEPRYAWFKKGYAYAATQTRAIPALSQCSPTELHAAVWAVMRGADFPDPDEGGVSEAGSREPDGRDTPSEEPDLRAGERCPDWARDSVRLDVAQELLDEIEHDVGEPTLRKVRKLRALLDAVIAQRGKP